MADTLPRGTAPRDPNEHLRARFEQALQQSRPAPPPTLLPPPPARSGTSGPAALPVAALPTGGGAGLLPVDFTVIGELRGQVATQLAARTAEAGALEVEDREQLGWQLVVETVARWGTDYAATTKPLSKAQESEVAQAVFDDLFRAGRLQPLLNDPGVEDIRICGNDPVEVIYQDRPRAILPPLVASDADLVTLINQLARTQGQGERTLSPAGPTLNMRLVDGSRLTAAYLVTPRPQVVIRKHRLRSTHLGDLVGWGTLDSVLAQFLAAAVRARKNIFIVGGQGAGKTSLLRAMSREIAPGERIGTLESEFELWLHELEGGPQVVPFEEREGNGERDAQGRLLGQITMADLFPQLLRMSLRRVIVGEVRSVEVVPMLHAMNEGEGGSMCTLHARTARSAIDRVVTLCLESGIGMTTELAYRLIAQAVDFIVYIRQVDETEIGGVKHRFVEEVLEVTGIGEGGRPAVQRIFAPRGDGEAREPRGVPHTTPLCIDDLERAGFNRQWLHNPAGSWGPKPQTVRPL